MKRSLLVNLILVLAVFCLWWLLENQQTGAFSLSEVVDEPVTTISIQRPGQPDILLHRQHTQWRITQPVNAPASPSRVNLLINLLSQPLDNRIQDDKNFARFGFSGTYIRLQYNQLKVGIGDQDPLSGKRYLLYDKQIFLTNDRIIPLLSAGAGSFIDHQPLTTTKSVESLILPGREQQQLTAEHQTFSSRSDTEVITSWQRATATRVQLNPAGLVPAGEPIVIKFADGSVAHFHLQLAEQLILTTADGTLDYIFPSAMITALIPATE